MIVSQKMADEAWELLARSIGTVDSTPLSEITEAHVATRFKYCASFTHPDTEYGSHEKFVAVDRAKHVLLAYLARQGQSEGAKPHGGVTRCPRCAGSGRIALQRGFKQMQVQCPSCRGNGELYDEREGEVNRNG